MALASAQVIDKIASILAAAGTAAGSRVYTSRYWPLGTSDLPALRVYADDEIITRATNDYPWAQQHELAAVVDGFVTASTDLDDAMHSLAEGVLGALFASQSTAQLSPLTGIDMVPASIGRAVETQDGADVGRVRMGLAIQYHTAVNAPGTLI